MTGIGLHKAIDIYVDLDTGKDDGNETTEQFGWDTKKAIDQVSNKLTGYLESFPIQWW